jgi:hypothetical protein
MARSGFLCPAAYAVADGCSFPPPRTSEAELLCHCRVPRRVARGRQRMNFKVFIKS